MTYPITSVSTTPIFQASPPGNPKIEGAAPQDPARDLMDLNIVYIGQVQQMLNNQMRDQDSRNATVNDILKVVTTLKEIELDGQKSIDPDVFSQQIALDPNSPAAARKPGEYPIASKSLWEVLVAYDICKVGDARPVTPAQLKLLIDKAENTNNAISTMSQAKAIVLNRFVSSRDQAFSLNANLLRQLMEMLLSIVKQM
jgi:hypothetical protein